MFHFLVSISLCVFVLGYSPVAYSWAHFKSLRDPFLGKKYLVAKVLNEQKINFCIDVSEADAFNPENLAIQTEMALKVWLEPLKNIGISGISIKNVKCDHSELSLKVAIRSDKTQYIAFEALEFFKNAKTSKQDAYPRIIFNTAAKRKHLDTLEILKPGELDFRNTLRRLTRRKIDSKQFGVNCLTNADTSIEEAKKKGYMSIFHLLVHEVGHAFGLCDTYEDRNEDLCDKEYTTRTHNESVMKDCTQSYLTKEDVEGITSLFLRFQK